MIVIKNYEQANDLLNKVNKHIIENGNETIKKRDDCIKESENIMTLKKELDGKLTPSLLEKIDNIFKENQNKISYYNGYIDAVGLIDRIIN